MIRLDPRIRWMAIASTIGLHQAASALADEPISFSLQVRPILSDKCFHCHGPDASHREANLRLDDEASAKTKASQSIAVVPHQIEKSELWKRINSDDADTVMPPPSTHKTLSPEQKEIIRRWISEGANWGGHWSFAKPQESPLPAATANDAWVKNPIDAWALDAMRKHKLAPAPQADAYTICRRLHLDLIGLPPTPERVQAFVSDFQNDSHLAIQSLTTELLSKPQFGEHWARMWLDLARYADTKGYEKDLKRDMWPYRDWVINAFNRDMPLEQFTAEQLAGDLLENATQEQKIATAFHRATLANDEGGTDDEEFRIAAVKDRVDTTLQVWMGLTAGCAKCHSHKYDPITIDEYYQFYAIFNQTEDADRYDDEPRLPLPSYDQQSKLARLQREKQDAIQTLNTVKAEATTRVESQWTKLVPTQTQTESDSKLIIAEDRSIYADGPRPDRDVYTVDVQVPEGTYTHFRIEALTHKLAEKTTEGVGRNPTDPNFVLSEFSIESEAGPSNATSNQGNSVPASLAITKPRADFEQAGWPATATVDNDPKTGWAISPRQLQSHWITYEFASPIEIKDKGTTWKLRLSQQFGGGLVLARLRFSVSSASSQPLVVDDLPEVREANQKVSQLDSQIAATRETIPKLPVLRELPSNNRRVTRIHNRGNFLDPGPEVQPSLLSQFASMRNAQPVDRLAVAQWLTSQDNPLTARVMANRVWAQLFGRGLVETEEDFGAQGALPSHPELLDWLAVEYQKNQHGSLKSLLRTIVSSNTYQQAFVLDATRQQLDPRNVWLSRGARFRLTAEEVRDQSLAIAGLLSNRVGGPPAMPPQPDGLWRSTYNGSKWVTSRGDDRYRRGVYTFWKRTTPYPSMETFDASTREVCQIRRISTNTPMQALVTLNDPVYVEASIAFAQRMIASPGDDQARLTTAWFRATSRPARVEESNRLIRLLTSARQHYLKNPDEAKKLLAARPLEPPEPTDTIELAAWTIVSNAILNLDELVMRP